MEEPNETTQISMHSAMKKQEDMNDEAVAFNLNRDIYNFVLLCVEKDENLKICSNRSKAYSLYFVAFLSLLVQISGIAAVLSVGTLSSSNVTINCASNDVELNNSTYNINDNMGIYSSINNASCEIIEEKHIHLQPNHKYATKPTIFDYAARVISFSMVLCFMAPTIVSFAKISVIYPAFSNKHAKFGLIFYILIQATFLVTCIYKIGDITLHQSDIADILSVGIGFIILMEVDDKLYDVVSILNPYGDELFEYEVKKEEMQHSFYQKFNIEPIVWDIVVLGVVFFAANGLLLMFALFEHTAVVWVIFGLKLLVVLLFIAFPFIYCLFVCTRKSN